MATSCLIFPTFVWSQDGPIYLLPCIHYLNFLIFITNLLSLVYVWSCKYLGSRSICLALTPWSCMWRKPGLHDWRTSTVSRSFPPGGANVRHRGIYAAFNKMVGGDPESRVVRVYLPCGMKIEIDFIPLYMYSESLSAQAVFSTVKSILF